MTKAFDVDLLLNPNNFTIVITQEVVDKVNTPIYGSYNILAARLFKLPYHQYLRMVRDLYNGTLKGKSGGYISYYFKEKADANRLTKELNERWAMILKA